MIDMKHKQISNIGEIAILPLAAGAAVYGFAFGFLAAQQGIPWWGVAIMSGAVHAGSSQIVAVEQTFSTSSVVGAIFAGAILNLRYIGIVASLIGMLNGLSLWAKLIAIHITSDESWALTISEVSKNPTVGLRFLLGAGTVMIVTWVISTASGALIGATIPDLKQFGLGFAFTAAFIAMARALWRGPSDILPCLATFLATVFAVKLGLSSAHAIVIGAVTGLIASQIIRRVKGAL